MSKRKGSVTDYPGCEMLLKKVYGRVVLLIELFPKEGADINDEVAFDGVHYVLRDIIRDLDEIGWMTAEGGTA